MKFKAGCRYLVEKTRSYLWSSDLIEIKILEVSPSGLIKVKYLFEDGGTLWERPDAFKIIECLDSPKLQCFATPDSAFVQAKGGE